MLTAVSWRPHSPVSDAYFRGKLTVVANVLTGLRDFSRKPVERRVGRHTLLSNIWS